MPLRVGQVVRPRRGYRVTILSGGCMAGWNRKVPAEVVAVHPSVEVMLPMRGCPSSWNLNMAYDKVTDRVRVRLDETMGPVCGKLELA